ASVLTDTLSIGPLHFSTQYYWHVSATTASGQSAYSAAWKFTTISPSSPTATTLPATNVTASSATFNASVNPNGNATNVKFQYGTTTAYGNAVNGIPAAINGTTLISITNNLQGLAPNKTYHYRVCATDAAGASYGDDQSFTTPIPPYPANYSIADTVPFPVYQNSSGYKPTDYRLIGLPGACNMKVAEYIAGQPNSAWVLYWDNGLPTNGLMPFDGSSQFRFLAGRAFWMIHRGPWILDTTVATAPLDTGKAAVIPLHPGWNLITNPYTAPVQWAAVQDSNGVADPIYSFGGSFTVSSVFQPYKGYYYFNSDSSFYLRIPYTLLFTSSQSAVTSRSTQWQTQIVLSSETGSDSTAWIGVSDNGSRKQRITNFHKPEVFADIPHTVFQRPEWDPRYSNFATDIRSTIGAFSVWDFDVLSPERTALHLSVADVQAIPSQFSVVLIDKTSGKTFDLRSGGSYEFRSQQRDSRLELAIGEPDSVRSYIASVPVPTHYALGINYPNPFNPSTSIPVEIAASTRMTLTIFNVFGELVRTLYDAQIGAGMHSFNWDGRDRNGTTAASGVYYYRMVTGTGVSLIRKMVMLK
ncbi:MAG TPA: FlgD immunoglobulin-like domain containing protein, partial [Bacteroidota bacterium]|nr:FlgD immunoglobulin-like domain containing protein [Bacteroidota bacterium]